MTPISGTICWQRFKSKQETKKNIMRLMFDYQASGVEWHNNTEKTCDP